MAQNNILNYDCNEHDLTIGPILAADYADDVKIS